MGWERGVQANAVPLFLGFPFSAHWLRPYQGRATFWLFFRCALRGSALSLRAQPMGCERDAQANAVPLFLGFSFTSHWLLPYQGSATFWLPFDF